VSEAALVDFEVRWDQEFFPCIRANAEGRVPTWYVLRYEYSGERLLRRILDTQIKVPYHIFTYLKRMPRSRPLECPWLPGYMFVEFDCALDSWQQLDRVPHVIGVLGDPSPLPAGEMDNLRTRLPAGFARPTEFSSVAPGQRVRVKAGVRKGNVYVVLWSDRKHLKIMDFMFNRPQEVLLSTADVEVLG
jgi:transcription antitermination factor NusG